MTTAPEPLDPAGPNWTAELEHIRRRLHEQFDGAVTPATVDDSLTDEATRFEGARITLFVPILVEKAARARLRDLAVSPRLAVVRSPSSPSEGGSRATGVSHRDISDDR